MAAGQRLWLTTSTLCPSGSDERAVVARVVDGALAGTAVVLVARGERGGVEPRTVASFCAGNARWTCSVSGRSSSISEKLKFSPTTWTWSGLSTPIRSPACRSDRRVKALGRGRIADADPEVVDAAVGHGVLALRVHRLRAVAVRVEQEAAVVVRPVDRARAGRAAVAVTRVDPPPARRRPRPLGTALGSRRAGRGSRGARGPSARCPSLPTRRARRRRDSARRPDGEDGAVEALGRGEVPTAIATWSNTCRGYRCGHARIDDTCLRVRNRVSVSRRKR